jgi:DNA-binding response OmpR family regulator
MLRRSGAPAAPAAVSLGRLEYNLAERQVHIAGAPLLLPRRELALLDALVRRAGRVVLREHLESEVYGFDDEVQPSALEAVASRLRRRLADEGAAVDLHGVRGVGYMLRAA